MKSYELNEAQGRKKVIVRLFRVILGHPGPLVLGLGMVLLNTFATLLEPRIFGYVIDEAIVPKKLEHLKMAGAVFLIATCVRVISAIQQGVYFELLGQRVAMELRTKLFAHLQRLPVQIFDQQSAGGLMTRVTNDIAALNEMFSAGFLTMLFNILLVIGIVSWLLILNVKLTLIVSTTFPFLAFATVYFTKKLKIAYRDARTRLARVNSFLAENLAGMKIIQLFNRQIQHLERFDRLNAQYMEAQVASIRAYAFFQPAITLASGVAVGLAIWVGGALGLQGVLTVGVLFAFFSYILSLFQPLREIADKWNIFLSGIAAAERIFSVFDWPTEKRAFADTASKEGSQTMPHHRGLRGHIVFENVWFAYQDEEWVLRNFSLEISAGEKLGVVGHTGAGKTTLISLLLRFYHPQRGRILIDGKDIRDIDLKVLRSSIGIVQQDVFLFSGSFEDNIHFWAENRSEDLDQLLKDFNLETRRGDLLQERGSNFSMGERQLIAFSRVIAANPDIWILDEATANMDSYTESVLQKALDKASVGKTSILIAHRLATVRNAGKIIVLNKGCLVESGTHDSLLAENGLYARLYRFQAAHSNSVALDSAEGDPLKMHQ